MTLNSIPTPTPEPKMTEQVIKLLTDDGDPYLGRFMGARIGEDVYLLPDGDVRVHFECHGEQLVVDPDDPDLDQQLPPWAYFEVCRAFGRKPIVDLDKDDR